MACTNIFKNVQLVPTADVLNIQRKYLEDVSPNKVNLSIGVYRDHKGRPFVLPVVKEVEMKMAQQIQSGVLNHEYLAIDGLRTFTDGACKLLLGEHSCAIKNNRVCGVQAISGTGSICLGLKFLYQFYPCKTTYVSKPAYSNHAKLMKAAGYTDIREYRYYNADTRAVDFETMREDLQAAPEGSVIVLQACAHNPTGVDLNQEQWKSIAGIMKEVKRAKQELDIVQPTERKLFPFFDVACQGLASGDTDSDAWAVRYFADEAGFEFIAAQSFAKNFGLANERVGNCCVVTSDSDTSERVRSQLKAIVRPMWSNPPNHGARIVATVLNNKELTKEWKDTVRTMVDRMLKMRMELHSKLRELGTPGNWDHVINQRGTFSFTGLNLDQVRRLGEKHHVYLLDSGCMDICSLTSANLDYVANAINEVVLHEQRTQRSCPPASRIDG